MTLVAVGVICVIWNGIVIRLNVTFLICKRTVGEDVATLPTRHGRGQRSDLDEVVLHLQEGHTSADIARSHPRAYLLHHKGIEALEHRLAPAATPCDCPGVFVLSGAPRVGKTGAFWDIFGDKLFDLQLPGERSSDLLRWEGFDPRNHVAVLIDEFSGQIDLNTAKRICDRWPFWARMFGRPSMRIRPQYVCFTSQSPPDMWWSVRWHSLDGAAMRARITYYKWCDTYADVDEAAAAIRRRLAASGTSGTSEEGPIASTVPRLDVLHSGGSSGGTMPQLRHDSMQLPPSHLPSDQPVVPHASEPVPDRVISDEWYDQIMRDLCN